MNWSTIAWIVIAIVAILVMARGCGGMMRGMGCGMPRRSEQKPEAGKEKQSGPTDKVA